MPWARRGVVLSIIRFHRIQIPSLAHICNHKKIWKVDRNNNSSTAMCRFEATGAQILFHHSNLVVSVLTLTGLSLCFDQDFQTHQRRSVWRKARMVAWIACRGTMAQAYSNTSSISKIPWTTNGSSRNTTKRRTDKFQTCQRTQEQPLLRMQME